MGPRRARELHPLAWWGWAVALAGAASLTTNPVLLGLLLLGACLVVAARRGDHPWSRSFRLYLVLGAVIVAVRVGFRVLLGGAYPGATVWVHLPQVPLPDWVAGVTLLGDVTREAVLGGLYDGLRLATIVVCVGAANSLANPKRLLASLPAALYELGTALVIAVSVLPQLAESVARVRRARELRGGDGGRLGGVRRVLVPVLEDALDRSFALAASMDARGYGRAGPAPRRRSGALLLTALVLLAVGVYGALDPTAPAALGWPALVLGGLVGTWGVHEAGRAVQRTRYRPPPWHREESAVLVLGAGVLAAVAVAGHSSPLLVRPDVTSAPTLGLGLLLAALLAAAPALVAPPGGERA